MVSGGWMLLRNLRFGLVHDGGLRGLFGVLFGVYVMLGNRRSIRPDILFRCCFVRIVKMV